MVKIRPKKKNLTIAQNTIHLETKHFKYDTQILILESIMQNY